MWNKDAIRERYRKLLLDLMFGEKRLKDVPKLFCRPIACMLGIINYPEDIAFVPEEQISPQMVQYVFRKVSDAKIFKSLPVRARTKENCLIALQENPSVLQYIPTKFLTEDICLDIVKKRPILYWYVPNRLISKKIISVVLENLTDEHDFVKDYMHESFKYSMNALFQYKMDNIPGKDTFEAYINLGKGSIGKIEIQKFDEKLGDIFAYNAYLGCFVCRQAKILHIEKNEKNKNSMYRFSPDFPTVCIGDTLVSHCEYPGQTKDNEIVIPFALTFSEAEQLSSIEFHYIRVFTRKGKQRLALLG